MNIEEKARELLVQERHQIEHLDENMLTRGVEEVEHHSEGVTEEKARELLANNRLHNENLAENMLTRAVEEV
jgi:hypothetical protein